MTQERNRIHIFPCFRKGRGWSTTHCTDKTGMCWCKPELKQPCPEAGDRNECKPDCWRCGGLSLVDPWNDWMGILIVHDETQAKDLVPENLRI